MCEFWPKVSTKWAFHWKLDFHSTNYHPIWDQNLLDLGSIGSSSSIPRPCLPAETCLTNYEGVTVMTYLNYKKKKSGEKLFICTREVSAPLFVVCRLCPPCLLRRHTQLQCPLLLCDWQSHIPNVRIIELNKMSWGCRPHEFHLGCVGEGSTCRLQCFQKCFRKHFCDVTD